MHHPSLPAMRALVLEPDAPLCDLLNDFIQEFVFVNHNYGRSPPRAAASPASRVTLLLCSLSSAARRRPDRSRA